MVINPAIVALVISSFIIAAMVLYASYFGLQIIRRWDIKSGSEFQLGLERKTYLISTIINYAFAFQLISLFLFIHTADDIHRLFAGAMCAAGTLNVNGYGYPSLVLKIVNFLLAGVWLIINAADNRAHDYPLIRKKYIFLLTIAPVVLTEVLMQSMYFLSLRADVITSCCGSIFSFEKEGLFPELISLSPSIMMAVFYATGAAVVILNGVVYAKGKGYLISAALSGIFFIVSSVSIFSFIAIYYYELPTHRCPFCILQREYGYIGYPLYLSLLIGTVCGTGSGILSFFVKTKSLINIIAALQKRLVIAALVSFLAFIVISSYPIIFSDFKLQGY
jgi:hypothetical protein